MTEQRRERPPSESEIEGLAGEQLPERAATSRVSANVAIPIDAAVAAAVLSDAPITYADADETGGADGES
jgi:hypothetical protein